MIQFGVIGTEMVIVWKLGDNRELTHISRHFESSPTLAIWYHIFTELQDYFELTLFVTVCEFKTNEHTNAIYNTTDLSFATTEVF